MSTSEYPAQRFGGMRLRPAAGARTLPAETWLLALLVALAAAIRILVINDQSFWQDEALTAYEAGLPFGAMVHTVLHIETTPPLYFVVIWVWGHLFGTGEIALRSFSTIAGIALVPIAYLAGRELASRWAGLLGAALVAVNPFMIWYSQEARAYMLLAALTGASFLWFVRARREPTRRNLGWWALFSSLALMTHFFAGFAVAPEALWLLWLWRGRAVALAVGVVAAVQVAMAPLAFTDTTHGAGWIARAPLVHRIGRTANEWAVSVLLRRLSPSQGLIGAAILVLLLALLVMLSRDRRTLDAVKVSGAVAGFVFIAPLALALVGQDYFLARNEIPAFIPVVTVIAAACVAPRVWAFGAMLAAGLLALFSASAVVVQTSPWLQRPAWRDVAHALGDAPVPRAVLVADGTTADPLKIYMPHVKWSYPPKGRTTIREVDVVGAIKLMSVLPAGQPSAAVAAGAPLLKGRPLPVTLAPPGTRLAARFRVHNWVVARFTLDRPLRAGIPKLQALSPRFFRHAPKLLLVFLQQPGR